MLKKKSKNLNERLLDIKEAAEFLNVSEISIRRWTNSGALKCYRVGGKRERRFYMGDLEEFLNGLHRQKVMPLGYRGLRAPDRSHMTHFYSGNDEALEVSAAFVLSGLEDSEVVLAVMPPENGQNLKNVLQRKGRSIGGDIKEGRLIFSSGMNSPKEMIRYLAGFAETAEKIRVVGDMVWVLEKGWDLAALVALEEAADFLPRSETGLLLCQYSLTDFSGAHIMMAAELHKHMVYKGRMENSPYYRKTPQPIGSTRDF